jgi:SAM-dependent methyltransferase
VLLQSREDRDRLTELAYWDSQYDPAAPGVTSSSPRRATRWLRRLLGPKMVDLMREYRDYLLWDVIYPAYLPHGTGARILEVGSAPGTHLVQLRQSFGCEPYGVEYAPRGAALNRKLFELHGLDPAHVILADFLSAEFQTRYRGCFDVVVSRGFIEHFSDVDGVVAAHVNVLAPGGLLAVTIPNLRGINYGLAWFFCREVLAMHNLSIMNRDAFAKLFDTQALIPLFCDYFGAFSFGLFNTSPGSPKRRVLAICMKAQLLLNAAFRMLFKPGRAEHRCFSAHLLFIGRKAP